MKEQLLKYWEDHPLRLILMLSLFFRLVSVLFSQGYGMHDDHFLVIEAAQSLADGYDYNNWLPKNSVNGLPTGHSFFYVGLHYIFFQILDFFHITNPDVKMYFIRLIHALLSMLTVYFGFRISLKLWGLKNAKIIGLLLGLYWFMPILSVRNMVEVVCIPFTMIAFWFLIRYESMKGYVLAGIFIGLSIGIRIQMYLFLGGIGLVLLYRKEVLGAIMFGAVSIVTLFFTQITDLFLWGKPFAELTQYILYNSTHYEDYITKSWFQYFFVIAGILVPPVSLFLFFGYFRNWKKNLLIFLPTLIFLLFHSYYPNKQERFILPFIPFFIMLGVNGWTEFHEKSRFWLKRPKTYRYSLVFFLSLNTMAILFISPASTKKSRIDTMSFLREMPDVNGLFFERTEEYGCYMLPLYYLDNWETKHVCFSKTESGKMDDQSIINVAKHQSANYVLFMEEVNADQRIARFKKIFPGLVFVAKIEPSYLDKLLHFLNPVNKNESVYIYKIRESKS